MFEKEMLEKINALERRLAKFEYQDKSSGGSGGVTDHGALSGLGDDDHTQYLNNSRGDARYLGKTAKASDSDKLDGIDSTGFVLTSGNQTILGNKTFGSFPVTPSSLPSQNYQVANMKYVDYKIEGILLQIPTGATFFPLTTMGKVVDGTSMTVGTTNYYAYNYGVPTNATAITARIYASWNSGGWHNVRAGTYGVTDYCIIARPYQMTSTVFNGDNSGIIPLGNSSRFWIMRDTVAPSLVYFYITGYFI